MTPNAATAVAPTIDEVDHAADGDLGRRLRRLEGLSVVPPGWRAARLIDRLRQPQASIEAAFERLAEAPRESVEISRAAEWLLDNHYIVRRAFRILKEEFPGGFERRLPRLEAGPLRGLPRIYALAVEIAAEGHAHLDLQATRELLRRFHSPQPLTIAETWALPTMLRLVLLEHLSTVVGAIAPSPQVRPAATANEETVSAVVAGCVRALRELETTDWKDFVESVSPVEEVLRRDQAGVYARMDFATRDSYRKAVEELARGSGRSEPEVAEASVRLAHAAGASGAGRASHVGYHLIDAGRPALEDALGYRPEWRTRLRAPFGRNATAAYIGGVALLTAALLGALTAALFSHGAGAAFVLLAALLAAAPASAIAVTVVNGLVTRLLPPSVLPKMDFDAGIAPEARTVVAVPALITNADEVATLLRDLEIRFLANEDANLCFALLTDFGDAPAESMPSDEALTQVLADGIRSLNAQYGSAKDGQSGPFHLLHRPRRWSPSERCWMGWERKRGKLTALNRLLEGGAGADFCLRLGDEAALRAVRFVITLDADTELPRGTANRLVAALAHPLNRAETDPRTGAVLAGYTVLQPRVEISPLGATSRFARLFSAGDGLDPYTRAVSDTYQDLFGEGIFAGKGIYDAAAFERSLSGRVPAEVLLSHDLFEGIHGRAGLVTDVALLEDYPDHYLAYARRMHRWARGDWQLLPWLGRHVPLADGGRTSTRLSPLSRWKILDNLRRTTVAPSLLAYLIVAWLCFPPPLLLWTTIVLLVYATAGLIDLSLLTARSIRLRSPFFDFDGAVRTLRATASVCLFEIAFLPHQAVVLLDACGRTLWRLGRSRRNLLQWRSAAHTAHGLASADSRRLVWKEMAAAPATAIVLAALLAVLRPTALLVAAPFLVAWLLSPEIAAWVSRPAPRLRPQLNEAEILQLRLLARRTWSFFETFGGPEDQWLPPDHFQEDPRGITARRTSPTNIGLLQLSTLCAYDLGYQDLLGVALRLKNVFDTLDRMERYRGHLLNWYSTATLEPLLPRYVSTVDSGNLVGCMIAVEQACAQFPDHPLLRAEAWDGFLDTMRVLGDAVGQMAKAPPAPDTGPVLRHLEAAQLRVSRLTREPSQWAAALADLSGEWSRELDRLVAALFHPETAPTSPTLLADVRRWSGQVHQHLGRMQGELTLFAPWFAAMQRPPAFFAAPALAGETAAAWASLLAALPSNPTLREMPTACAQISERLARLDAVIESSHGSAAAAPAARAWVAQLEHSLQASVQMTQYVSDRLQEIRERAALAVVGTDFGLLYDRRRRLFHIGYDVSAAKLDDHHYDLLASEARLASFLAIAKGDVPEEHWLHLGRPIGDVGGRRGLLSWSGTMFEYLMPTLVLREGAETLMGLSCQAAVQEQIAYAHKRGVPWGISESGYARVDAEQNYQYRAFGVPSLGFRREHEEELVVAPYASVLALAFDPRAVVDNIAALRKLGLWASYGFYEAADFTWSRLRPGRRYTVVRSFMAHHQGMILASLTNYLKGDSLIRRFHATPLARTAELLLFERPPRQAPIETAQPPTSSRRSTAARRVSMEPWRPRDDAAWPQLHVLSNDRYSLLLSDTGGGFASWDKMALTRWTADPTLDDDGFRLYVRDPADGPDSPLGANASPKRRREVHFHPHMVEYHSRDEDISVRESVCVAAETDAEIRLVTLTNEGDRRRRLNLIGYGEVVLQDAGADRRHPAFSKMFVESEYVSELKALLFRRRTREPHEREVYLVHMLVLSGSGTTSLGCETSRERFLGRGGTIHAPAALLQSPPRLTGATGATLDPVMVLGAQVELAPHRSRQIAYVTLVAESREAALKAAASWRSLADLEWAFQLARQRCETELNRLGLGSPALATAETLLSLLLYPNPVHRAPSDVLERNTLGRSGLWRFAVSGDLPILLVRLREAENAAFLHEVLRAQSFWRGRGIAVDLVILNERASSYSAELADRIGRALAAAGAEGWMHRPGGVFLVHGDQINEDERTLLLTSARVVLEATAGSVGDQLNWAREAAQLPPLVPTSPVASESAKGIERPTDLLFDNGIGGFTPDGTEYVIHLESGRPTPAPWVNVIANPGFGCVVTESGGGYTWAENSGENRLTPWTNDPVSDTPGESIHLRDEETGALWSPTPLPADSAAPHRIRHGAGYTIFEHRSHDLYQELRLFVAAEDPVKVVQLRLANCSDRPRRLTATYYVEWVLGTARDGPQAFILPSFDTETEALLARNPWNEDFADRVAFVAASQRLHGFTTDRTEFLGRIGRRSRPAALARVGLANNVRPGLDPCAALQVHVDLAPGESKSIHFVLGQGRSREEALRLARHYRSPESVEAAWISARERWNRLVGKASVRTPSPELDLMLNRWLLYQTVSSRLWGRTGFYQSSGAFGFRDQLQDVLALAHFEPDICREHIIESARHQFEAGDVLHWWHPPAGAGIRSRCSDDMLWLPFVVARYAGATGDLAILGEEIPFLRGEPLPATETERYGRFGTADKPASLYEHCLRALLIGRGVGPHGLPLFGSGDWNDGMNRVGVAGRGESVWLGWFRHAVLMEFAPLCEATGHAEQAADLRREASSLRSALETHAWDGEWYLRGYYDDGSRLGSAERDACRIDSIAQSWAVLSGAADPQRARTAMRSARAQLVRDGLLLLFAPPFDQSDQEPGYIRGYPPGVRENGGQYTHAAVWFLWALLEHDEADLAVDLFGQILPISQARKAEMAARYRLEPYALAADVYGAPPFVGRGGWSWYTGSAGWAHRLGWEKIVGVRLEGGSWRIDPCVPRSWPGFEVTLRYGASVYEVSIANPDGVNRGVRRVSIDGIVLDEALIPRVDDGAVHRVEVVMGLTASAEVEERPGLEVA